MKHHRFRFGAISDMQRLKSFFNRFQSLDTLLKQVKNAKNTDALAAMAVLIERMAHQDGSLVAADFAGAKLSHLTLASSELESIDFRQATLHEAYFYAANLERAIFDQADLTGANFRSANLQSARLQGATLDAVNFARSHLQGAQLQKARLSGANFWQTNLIGTVLSGASLHGMTITDVICDETTILPNGEAWQADCDWTRFTVANPNLDC